MASIHAIVCAFFIVVFWVASSRAALQPQDGPCSIPVVIRGAWFSRELGENTVTEIDPIYMSRRGRCTYMRKYREDDILFVFREGGASRCHHCVRIYVRTINVLEKRETGCVDVAPEDLARAGGDVSKIIDTVCRQFDHSRELDTLFSENPTPVNCRSSFEGVWHFTYKNQYRFTGDCNHPEARLQSCQVPGSQFLIQNQKFNITYRPCPGMKDSLDAVVEYSCLGDWFVGKNHYIAVVNTKESRKDEKYRCMLRNRDDDLYVGATITAECNILKSPETSPERLYLTPIKAEAEIPGCTLPQDYSGQWINTANIDAEVVINKTHIVETYHPDEGRYRETVYVCKQQRGARYMMARMGIDGCQKDYVCFEFVKRHHNVIRYRKGTALINGQFSTVCSWVQFPVSDRWLYNVWLAKNPVPITCPVAGKFRFQQSGEVPFETRILGGVTQSPRPNIYCKENISDFSVCGDQKEIWIDAEYCLSVDHLGRPVDIYSDPDYKLKCIGYWKENLRSYLITYDELDAFSKYRCWVYQRSDLNAVIMSQAYGSFCDVHQEVNSSSAAEGAAVSLTMVEYERERDQCPMHFDDGANPWESTESFVRIFPFGSGADARVLHFPGFVPTLACVYATAYLLK